MIPDLLKKHCFFKKRPPGLPNLSPIPGLNDKYMPGHLPQPLYKEQLMSNQKKFPDE
jgi:hypothetical protein